jgi:hypothetical protein
VAILIECVGRQQPENTHIYRLEFEFSYCYDSQENDTNQLEEQDI